jgi:glycosyltransferase involved in cell wall biosynthesis
MKEACGISVFVPMFNEAENVSEVLSRLQKVLAEITPDYEILAIDDGSLDSTAERVLSFSTTDPRIRLVQHPRNLGYGAALRTGFLNVSKEIVFYTDADLPVDPRLLTAAVPRMEHALVLIGNRSRRDNLKRRLFSASYHLLLRLFFGLRVRDVNFSFKLFRKEIVDRFKDRLRAESVFIDGEILVHVHRMGVPIEEIPVEYKIRERGASTLGNLRQARFTFREILEFYFERGKWAGKKKRQATDNAR